MKWWSLKLYVLLGTLIVGAVPLGAVSPATAQSSDERPPDSQAPEADPPAGFARESVDGVEWLYPTASRSRIRSLQVLQREAWERTAGALGLQEAPRLAVRVARNPDEMQALAPPGVRLPAYAIGVALPEQPLILLSLTAPDSWETTDLETTFVHELSHVALYQAVRGHPVPRWFSEGLAIDQANERSLSRIRDLWEATLRGKLIPLSQLSRGFAGEGAQVRQAYAQSADFVAFLREADDDQQRFRALIADLGDGTSFETAFLRAFHVPLGYMEREWRAGLRERYGRLPMLLTSLTAFWVLGALLLIAAYIRKRYRDRATVRRWDEEQRALDLAQAARLQHPLQLAVNRSAVDGSPRDRAGRPAPNVATLPGPMAPPLAQPRLAEHRQAEHAQPESGSAERSQVDATATAPAIPAEYYRQDPDVPTIEHDGRSYTLH